MFWKRRNEETKLPGPKEINQLVGMHMIVDMKKDPDWVWGLKNVTRPLGNKDFYCRVFSDAQVTKAGITVKDWTSLDEHPELVLWEGYVDKSTNNIREERFVKASN